MIDSDGFRPNVGIILANHKGEVLWARRIGQDSWQFPQGGIKHDESPEQALYRELAEEIGLSADDVEVISCTRGWLRYRLPRRMVRQNSRPVCVGQKQKWFLLRMLSPDASVRYPLGQVFSFQREVYRRALRELAPRLFSIVDQWQRAEEAPRRQDPQQ